MSVFPRTRQRDNRGSVGGKQQPGQLREMLMCGMQSSPCLSQNPGANVKTWGCAWFSAAAFVEDLEAR